MRYWYNINTGQVEEDASHSVKGNLMGPYSTREEAESAIATAAEKTKAWDEEDRRRAAEEGRD